MSARDKSLAEKYFSNSINSDILKTVERSIATLDCEKRQAFLATNWKSLQVYKSSQITKSYIDSFQTDSLSNTL